MEYNNSGKALDNLHPFSKGSVLIFMSLGIFLFRQPLVYLLSVLIILMISSQVDNKRGYFKKVIITNLVMFLPMFIMQVLFKPGETKVFSWFIINITEESIVYASSLFARLSIFSSLILLFFHTTTLKAFVTSLEQSGIPKSVGFMIMSTYMIVPEIVKSFNNIMEAQKVRGIEVEGGLILRAKAFLPMLMPLIMRSLLATEERALTLEARGFTSNMEKNYLNPMIKSKTDRIIIMFFITTSILLIIGKMVIKWII